MAWTKEDTKLAHELVDLIHGRLENGLHIGDVEIKGAADLLGRLLSEMEKL